MKNILARRILFCLLFVSIFVVPTTSRAQTQDQIQETDTLARARVITAVSEGAALVPGTNVTSTKQTLTVEILDGTEKSKIVTFENDYTQLTVGEIFYIRHITSVNDGTDRWSVADPYRLPVLFGLALIFVVLLFVFGGIQGIRGLLSLLGSIVIIFYLLIPNIYAGHSPILIALGISALIIILGSYLTHGISRTTTSAMVGMIVTVIITGLGTYGVIHIAHLSGFTSETNVYLNFDTNGRINMLGLLFGGIMIGLLGVLYDIAIGQAVAVEELFLAGHYTRAQVYARAMRIGREHIGALVNTLAIAYVGTSLPLMLLFKESTAGVGFIINSEIFATEIIRILMGSIGLVLAVPITTLIASYALQKVHRSSGIHSHGNGQ
ncbi:MAG: hypothetical protein JWL75_517 [Parcubacteria group bacterium]|nr:hypothetical protein [Parcubacteria group bacterium]